MSKDKKETQDLSDEELNSVNGGATVGASKTLTVGGAKITSTSFFDEADAIFGKRADVKGSDAK